MTYPTLLRVALLGALVGSTDRIASAADEVATPPPLSWRDGRTTLELGGAQFNLSNRVQMRFTEADAATDASAGSFRIRRARTSLDGWFYRKELQFEVMVDWADSPLLEDLAFNWDPTGRRIWQLKAGQFKSPFGRQELTSDTAQQFVDRSIVSAEFERGRDQGVQMWGLLANRRIEYRAGVFNGNGRGRAANDNSAYQYDVRVMVQPWGDARYAEGDQEPQASTRVAFALNYERNDARPQPGQAPATSTGNARSVWGADLSIKRGGISLFAEGFDRTLTPMAGPAYKSNGGHLQAGVFVRPRVLEVAVRLAAWDPSDQVEHDGRSERGFAVNGYFRGQALKVQGDYRWLRDASRPDTDHELRAQLQFLF